MIAFLKRMVGTAKAASSSWAQVFVGFKRHRLHDFDSYLKAASKKCWAFWKASDLVAQQVMSTPFRFVRKSKPVEVPELERLLKSPNLEMTGAELLYLSTLHLKTTGNAFWLKDQPTKNGDRPKGLIPMNPKRVQIIPGRDRKVAGYIFRTDTRNIPLDFEEVIHFKRPHPDNEYWGLGDIEAGEEIFNEFINRDVWEAKFLEQGATPSGIVSVDSNMDEEQFQRIRDKWQKEYGGRENAGKTAFLQGKAEYQKLGLTHVEMQAIEKRRSNIEEIFIQCGVPLSVAGIRDAANFATSKIDRIRFKEFTILPIVRIFRDTIQSDLVPGFAGDGVEIEFELSGLLNVGEILNEWTPLFDRGGMTINELREKAGLERDDANPFWDMAFIASNYVPLELAGVSTPDAPTPEEEADQVEEGARHALLFGRNGHPRV